MDYWTRLTCICSESRRGTRIGVANASFGGRRICAVHVGAGAAMKVGI